MRCITCLTLVLLLALALVAGCAPAREPLAPEAAPQVEVTAPPATDLPAWMQIELTDVVTGETFRLSDFAGQPVLLESFAVWCPTCLRQQQQMAQLIAAGSDNVVHVSLDTDPNEDADRVREHLVRNGFDWRFTVAPEALTRALIDRFGIGVVSAPNAPVMLICHDGDSRLLPRGIKGPDTLRAEIGKGC